MIIFLYGPDTFRSRQKLQELKQKFMQKKDQRGFNVLTIDGGDLNIENFRRSALSAGLFAEKRLIIIENLFKQKKDKGLFQEIGAFIKQNKGEQSENVIIFWDETLGEDLNKEQMEVVGLLKKFSADKSAGKQKYSQEFTLLKINEIIKWIRIEVKNRGGQIQLAVAEFLAQQLGPDLWRLNNEIDKLLAAAQKAISLEDAKRLVYSQPEEEIWSLVDAVGGKNKARALKLLTNQIKNGAALGWLLSMLVRQYRILLQVKEAVDQEKNINSHQLAKQLKFHPFVCQKAMAQVQNYSLEDLKMIYSRFLDIDLKIKTTPVDPEVLLDLLIVK